MVVFEQKVIVFWQNGSFWANWFYLGKFLLFGQKVVVFGQKVVVFG